MTELSWCILRTGGSRTLPLCRSLNAAGLDAWTPTGVADRRRGRSRARVEAPAPILPTFVFAAASNIETLLALSSSPINPHPSFSVFHHEGRVAIVAEAELAQLRTEEGRIALVRKRRERHVFAKGAKVAVPDGPFAGLTGVVEDGGNGKFTLVMFGEMPIQIASFLLRAEDIQEGPAPMGLAAQVAALSGSVAEPPPAPNAGSPASGAVQRNSTMSG
ncbi:transcription termination/antitermination protein NusG [Sphingopyxis macrogoltabida]|uniref:transcription termination/antitermination protein NusG n=1 Tax=Sphingopyxis macrogoltabida TaxID=33050 RepID=UPI0006ED2166|nr:hypothetical protein [Sphingopyxis macrogoltabida]ALJ14105.1 peptidoglycan-associated lipoprotein [Sphingopyxis macrogoltabida]